VNLDHYRELLLAKERELVVRRARTGAEEREPNDEAGDVGDDSVEDEQKAKLFMEDEADGSVLDDVRSALDRVFDGSYGRCLVDGQPIPEKRLAAVPWAKYCAHHQAELESTQGRKSPTL
jgi:DnaK suppressor protein